MDAEQKSPDLGVEERREQSEKNTYRRSVYGVPLTITVGLGRTRLSVAQVLGLEAGSIVNLDAAIDDPIDLLVDNAVIARGELLETEDGELAVRITEVIEHDDDTTF